jgi:voltage-gated potassium channel
MAVEHEQVREAVREERQQLLDQISDALDKPMIVLAFVWLVLTIVDFVGYRGPLLDTLNNVIWAIFVFHFLLEFVIAPRKGVYLRRNWLTAIALAVPALRLLRIARLTSALRAARAARGLRLLRVVSTTNRGIRAVGKTIRRRGISYVLGITGVLTFIGAAGMYAFESPAEGGGLQSFGDALWWTAMVMVTMGSEYWPKTAEGRILGWLLALYAFAVFGYITATIASYFVGQDAQERDEELLRTEIRTLRIELQELRRDLAARENGRADTR